MFIMILNARFLTTLVMFALFAGACILATGLPTKAAFMPLLVGIPGALLCGAQLILDLRRGPDASAEKNAVADTSAQSEAQAFGWLALFTVALIGFGFVAGGADHRRGLRAVFQQGFVEERCCCGGWHVYRPLGHLYLAAGVEPVQRADPRCTAWLSAFASNRGSRLTMGRRSAPSRGKGQAWPRRNGPEQKCREASCLSSTTPQSPKS